MALTLGQLASGAGQVGTAWRQEEDAQRISRQNQLKIEEQNRLNRFRQNELQAQLPTQPAIDIERLGQPMGVDNVSPVDTPVAATPAAPAYAPAPQPTATPVAPVVPAGELTAAQYQAATPAQRVKYLQAANDRRLAATVGNIGLMAPAAISDALTFVPRNTIRGAEVLANMVGVPRIGKALGIYDQNVDRVSIPNMPSLVDKVTPYFKGQYYKLSDPQYLEQLKAADAKREKAAVTKPKGTAQVESMKVLTPEVKNYFTTLEQQNGIPQGVLAAIMYQESKGKPGLTSGAGAKGYFQFMGDTATQYGVKVNDLNSEAQGAAKFIGDLYRKYDGDMTKVLAGYNWGQGNVDRLGMDKAPKETKNYIPQVLARLSPVSPAEAAQETPKAKAAPALSIVQPVAAKVEAPAAKDQKKISDFYMGNPDAVTEDMAKATRQRDELVRLAKSYQNAGMGLEYNGVRAKIMEMDEGMFYLQGMQGLSDLSLAKDPRRLQAVWSRAKGQPIGIQPRSDGMYNIFLNGNKLSDPYSLSDVSEAARSSFDSAYVKQVTDMAIERSNKAYESQLKIGEIVTDENAKMLRELALEKVKGANAQRLEWTKATATMDIKPLGDGETVLFKPAGSNQVYMYNKSGRTIEIDGVKITSQSAVPITGMPTLEKLAR